MLFHSFSFLVFMVVVYGLLWLIRKNEHQKRILLVASYMFYMWWNPAFILLILYSTFLDFICGEKIAEAQGPKRRKKWLWISIAGNLLVLIFFKYFGFFSEMALWVGQLNGVEPNWSTVEIVLPLGISFFTFQSMSYTIDVYRRKLSPVHSFMDFALYISFFPQMIAGPIVRAKEFLPQLNRPRALQFSRSTLLLFAKGLFKKIVIADNLTYATDGIFGNPEMYSGGVILASSVLCYIQVYCDFSGYSDMAIALGRSMGFTFPMNFNKPMHARSLTDFWRRWHITLSTWFRDYVYVPLGGNRKRMYLNIFIVMLISGLWHGAGVNFILWGALHGLMLVLEKRFWPDGRGKWLNALFAHTTFAVLLIFFWSDGKGVLPEVLHQLSEFSFSTVGVGYLNIYFVTFIAAIFLFFEYVVPRFTTTLAHAGHVTFYSFWIVYGIALYVLAATYQPPFIYFQF